MRRISLLSVVLFSLSLLITGHSSAAAPFNVLVARDRTEPDVAVDQHHPSTIVIATNTNYDASVGGTHPDGYFTSHDGGRSFLAGNAPVIAPYTTEADPSILSAQNGTVFFTYLAEKPTYCSAAGGSAVEVTASYDGGRTFHQPTIVDTAPSDDKPFSAVESIPGQHVHVFVSWTRWLANGSEIWFARSTDGGWHFSPPSLLASSGQNAFGSIPVVGPHGQVYVAWSVFSNAPLTTVGQARLYLRTSSDDGVHFGPEHAITKTFRAIPRMAEPDSMRNLTFPSAAAAPNGTLYVTWAAVHHTYASGAVDADILVTRSSNGGSSWSKPERVNDVRTGDRFMPSIGVLPDGSLGLAFYDRRNGPSELDVYAAHVSFAGGFSRAPNVRVTSGVAPVADIYYIKPGTTCFSPGRFFGDYIGTNPGQGDALYVVWADTQSHTFGQTDIWLARVLLPALPTARRTRHG